MTARSALKLASRIDALLLLQLQQGIAPARMLADPLYARDVLLVCDAHRGSELAALAQQFRVVRADAAAERQAEAAEVQHDAARARGQAQVNHRSNANSAAGVPQGGFGGDWPGAAVQRHGPRQGQAGRTRDETAPRDARHVGLQRGHPDSLHGNLPDTGGSALDDGLDDSQPGLPHTARAPGHPRRAGDDSCRRNGAGFASQFFSSLFGPPTPLERAPGRSSVRPQRGWFGRWRDTGK